MSSTLSSTIAKMKSASKIHENMALVYWPTVVGKDAARASKAIAVREGTLTVHTRSSVWSHELMLHHNEIIKELNRLLEGDYIHMIVFRPVGVETIQQTTEPDPHPTDDQLMAVVLLPTEHAQLADRIKKYQNIQDFQLRTRLQKRIVQETLLRRWRLDHGWLLCPDCDAVYLTEGEVCPICSLKRY